MQDISFYVFYKSDCNIYDGNEFLDAIRQNTKFKFPKTTGILINQYGRNNSIMRFAAYYYYDCDYWYFLITNDERRKIIRYLTSYLTEKNTFCIYGEEFSSSCLILEPSPFG